MKVNGVFPALPSALLAASAAIAKVGATASSLRMVEEAAAVVMVAPVGLDRVTVKLSSSSTTVSPATLTVMVEVAAPAANETVPVGRTPPVKSAALAVPVTANAADAVPVRSPDRLTVKVNAVEPALPSALLAASAKIDNVASSFRMVDEAAAAVMVAPVGLDRVTVKPSSPSTVVSPATLIVIVAVDAPAANDTVPVGRTPPKSVALAVPVTAKFADEAPVRSPLRVTVKVNGVVPALPSAALVVTAEIASCGRPVVVTAIVSVSLPPKASVDTMVIVSLPPVFSRIDSAASDAFTWASVPVTLRLVVPDPVTPVSTVVDRMPPPVLKVVVKISAAVPSGSDTLTPVSARVTPALPDCKPGTVLIGGTLPLVVPTRKLWPKPDPMALVVRLRLKVTTRLEIGETAPKSSTRSLKYVCAAAVVIKASFTTVVAPTSTLKFSVWNPVPSNWLSSSPATKWPENKVLSMVKAIELR